MKTKKILTFSVLASIPLLAMGAIIGTREGLAKVFASNPETWVHYSGVKATAYNKGIKEYWVSCNTSAHQFTAPTGDVTIREGGTPTQTFINALESNDDRLLGRYEKILDFEEYADGTSRTGSFSYFVRNDSIFTVVANEGVGGSKALKVTNNRHDGKIYVDLNSDFLDAIFAKSEVKSLSFYARANVAKKEFRYQFGAGKAGYYEQNTDNFGITTNYKAFYLTRSVYEDMKTNSMYRLVNLEYASGVNDDPILYLDDVKVCYTDYTTYTSNSFENGYYYKNSDTNWIYRHAKNNQADFQITTSGASVATESSIDYSTCTEGIASIKVVKSASGNVNLTFGGASNFKPANLPDVGVFFDFKVSGTLNASWFETNGSITTGSLTNGVNGVLVYPFNTTTPTSRTGITIDGGSWQTFHLNKSDITSDGRFFIFPGGGLGTVNVDNVRFATGPLDSFEDAYAFSAGKVDNAVAGASSYPVTETIGTIPAVQNRADYIFMTEWGNQGSGTVPTAEITDELASDGDYSLKIDMNGTKPLRLRSSYLRMILKGGSLSFDVYTEDLPDNKLSLTTLGGNVKTIAKGQWTTITLTAADFSKDNGVSFNKDGRFTENAFGKGTIYVDNIRYTPAA